MKNEKTDVLIVTEYFHPDSASTGELLTELATGLQDRGLEVAAYTSQPNYHNGTNQKQPHNSSYKGVRINRIRAPQVEQSSVLRRLFNWTVFFVWMTARLLVSRGDSEQELLFVTNPPVIPIGMWIVHKLRGWEYTYVVYDLYPEAAVQLGYISKNGLIHRVWAALHRRVLRDANNVVALGPVMREQIIAAGGDSFDEEKVTIIHNWEDESFVTPKSKTENSFSQEHGLVEPFSLLYSGNVGAHHDLATVVRATTDIDSNTKVLIVGDGEQKASIVDLANTLGVRGRSVEFLPFQPKRKLPFSLTCSDVTIVSIQEGFRGLCVSSKLYSSLAAGQPILLVAEPDTDEGRIIERFDAGMRVTPGDQNGIVEAIETWESDPELVSRQGKNARTAFENHFTKKQSIDKYYQLLTG